MTNGEPYTNPNEPGRLDVDGNEWWACDPYPTWYRRNEVGTLVRTAPQWKDIIDREGRVNDSLYVLLTKDYCLHRDGLTCGGKEADHPMSGPYGTHNFVSGATQFVKATTEQIQETLNKKD